MPVWAISNFSSLRVFQRDDPIASIEIVPEAALDPETSGAKAEQLIRSGDPAGLIKAFTPLALADPPPTNDAKQLAGNLAHAARLVRSIVEDRLAELADAGVASAPLLDVRHDFREVLYAHPEAAGYDARRFDPLFAAAFAQTLAFGLLLAREASEQPVDHEAWRHMPEHRGKYPHGTARGRSHQAAPADSRHHRQPSLQAAEDRRSRRTRRQLDGSALERSVLAHKY